MQYSERETLMIKFTQSNKVNKNASGHIIIMTNMNYG